MRRRRAARFASSAMSLSGALDARGSLLFEGFASRAFRVLADRRGAVEELLPGRGRGLVAQRRGSKALGLGADLPPPLRQQKAGAVEVAGREPRRCRDLLRSMGRFVNRGLTFRPIGGQGGFHGLHWEGGEVDRLAAGGDRLQQGLGLGGEEDQVGEGGRLLQRLQQGVLALVAHRLRRLDHEDAPAALEGPVGGGADHPLAHLLDHVLGAARGEPDEVGVGRGIEQGAAAGVVRVLGRAREDLRREGPRQLALSGAAWSAEEVGMRGTRLQRGRQRQPGLGLVAPRVARGVGALRPREAADTPSPPTGPAATAPALTASITRAWTSSTVPAASTTRPGRRRSSRSPRRPRPRRAAGRGPRPRSGPRPRRGRGRPRGRSAAGA